MRAILLIPVFLSTLFLASLHAQNIDSVFLKEKRDIALYFNDGQFQEVIKRSENVLKTHPKDTALTVQRCISLLVEDRADDAVNQLTGLIKQKDSVAKYLMGFSMLLRIQDSGKYANRCGDQAIKLSPQSYYGYFVKGVQAFEDKQYESAKKLFSQAAQCKNNRPVDKASMNSFYARSLFQLGQKEEGFALIEKIVQEGSNENDVLENYANMLRDDKKFEKAAEMFKRLSDKNPNEYTYKLALIGAMNNSGKGKEACTLLDTMVAKDRAYEFLRYDLRCRNYFYIPAFADKKKYTFQCFVDQLPYNLIINNKAVQADGSIEFDWESSKDGAKGHKKIKGDAIAGTNVLKDKFASTLQTKQEETEFVLWLSKPFFEALKKNKSCQLKIGDSVEKFVVVEDNVQQPDFNRFETMVPVNGNPQYIEALHLICPETSHEIWINNSKEFPMIVKLFLGTWAMEITSID